MPMYRHPVHQRGFTLVELVVTLVVLAILTMIALPSYRDLTRRNRLSSTSNALLADISYARNEAITRGVPVSICAASATADTCSDSASYETGWLVYTYAPGKALVGTDYSADADDGNVLLRRTNAASGLAITAASATPVTFGQQGQLRPGGTSLTFDVCAKSGDTVESTGAVPGSRLSVNGSGSISTESLAVGAACTAK